jgi:PAS domain-containing protein
MVDVPASYGALLASHLEEAGWSVEREHADGAVALSAALHRRGWNAVLYGGDGRGAVPARKALALVRMADPHLPFLVVSPNIRRGDLSSVVRGVDDAAKVVSDPKQLSLALTKELEATRLRRRVGSSRHLLPAQQAIGDHLAAGLEPEELCRRVLATLGDSLNWTFGAVWRPSEDGSMLRCSAVWHAADAREETIAFARETQTQSFAPGQGMPGRVWAFRRPTWVPDISRDARMPRGAAALRAGLSTAIAFPLAVGDECLGVIEFFTGGVHEHNGEVSAMFATVGGQLAQYLARHAAQRDRARGFLDKAEALIVVLDADGLVQLANARACTAAGLTEAELIGREWAAEDPAVTWLSTPLDGGGALLLGQTAAVAV